MTMPARDARRPLPRRAALLVLVAALGAGRPAAGRAEEPPPAFQRPFTPVSLTLSLDGGRDRATGGGGETWRYGALALRGAAVLVERVKLDRDGPRGWGLVAGIEARGFSTDLAVVAGEGEFLRLGASLGGYYVVPGGDVYLVQAGAFIAEQGTLLDSPQLHPQALALGSSRVSQAVRLLYGASYTYALGRGLPLPIFGLEWRWAPAWRLNVILPAVVRVTWQASERLALGGGLGVAGDYFRYRAVDPSGAEPVRALEIFRLRLGPAARYLVAPGTFVGAAAGFEGASLDDGVTTRHAFGGWLQAFVGYGAAPGIGPEAMR